MESCKIRPYVLESLKILNSITDQYFVVGSFCHWTHTNRCIKGRVRDLDVVVLESEIDKILTHYENVKYHRYKYIDYMPKTINEYYHTVWNGDYYDDHLDLMGCSQEMFDKEDLQVHNYLGQPYKIRSREATIRHHENYIVSSSGKNDYLSRVINQRELIINQQLYNDKNLNTLL